MIQHPEVLGECLHEMELAAVVLSILGPDITADELRQVVRDGVAVRRLGGHPFVVERLKDTTVRLWVREVGEQGAMYGTGESLSAAVEAALGEPE